MTNVTNLINELHDISLQIDRIESRLFGSKMSLEQDFKLLGSVDYHTNEINSLEAEKTALNGQLKTKVKQLNNILN